jgi:hypothetical protein
MFHDKDVEGTYIIDKNEDLSFKQNTFFYPEDIKTEIYNLFNKLEA